MARTAPLLPPKEGRGRIIHSVPCRSRASGTHIVKERAISLSSVFSGSWADSVRRTACSLLPTTHFGSGQESAVWGRSASPRASSQSLQGLREFCEDESECSAFCTIQPYSHSLHHCGYVGCSFGATCTVSGGVACVAQPVSLAHSQNSTRLRDSVRQVTSQVQCCSRDFGGSLRRTCLVRGDCCPPGKGWAAPGRTLLSTGQCALRTSVPACCCHNSCLQHGLGRNIRRAGSLGALDRASTALAHQLPRAVGSASGLVAVPATAVRQACVGPYGQHCGCLVHQQAGRYTIMPHVTTRPPSPPLESHAAQIAVRCPHSGGVQSCSRCALTTAHVPRRMATPS